MWFNDLGFIENPFDDNANHKLVGYEDIIEDVLYNINAGNMVFIEGKEGTGKTSILKKATDFVVYEKAIYAVYGSKIYMIEL